MTQCIETDETTNSSKKDNQQWVVETGSKLRPNIPSPECRPKNRRKRRTFTSAQKLNILGELDSCEKTTQTREVLHREGLYSSQVTKWRAERVAGILCRDRSKAQKSLSKMTDDYVILEQKLLQTQLRLRQAESVIEAQKKIAATFFPETSFEPTVKISSSKQ